jgi:hypothetical protein
MGTSIKTFRTVACMEQKSLVLLYKGELVSQAFYLGETSHELLREE